MKRRRLLVDCTRLALATAIILATLPAVAHADTIEPTLIGPAELTVGQFVLIVVCVVVVVAVGIYALVRIKRRRSHEGTDGSGAGSDEQQH